MALRAFCAAARGRRPARPRPRTASIWRVYATRRERAAIRKERQRASMSHKIDTHELICVVEIPKGSRNKYEYDDALGAFKFDRLLMSAATYPTDYGFLRDTLAVDGDPLDALVCLYEPTFPGCLIPVKALGLFRMHDEKGSDDKVICVPLDDPYWNHYEEVAELPALLRQEIEQFFAIYKELEKGKSVTIDGWGDRDAALAEIAAARERCRQRA